LLRFSCFCLDRSNFVSKIVPGYSAIRFPVICSHGCRRTKQLFHQNVGGTISRQAGGKLKHRECKSLCSLLQILLHRSFYFLLPTSYFLLSTSTSTSLQTSAQRVFKRGRSERYLIPMHSTTNEITYCGKIIHSVDI